MNNQGFSMMEALVASMIFAIAVVGVFATMSSQKAPAVESDQRVQAAFVAKQYLESLRSKVDAQTYATGELSYGQHTDTVGIYTIDYFVSSDPGSEARKVDLNITW